MSGIYIHIPFCASRCIYCDFYSTTLRGKAHEYVDALLKEYEERSDFLPSKEPLQTIYIGGGTPSQLPISELKRLIDFFNNKDVKEFTIEANPEDICEEWAKAVGQYPNTRISIGVQSLNDNELRIINRRHNSKKPIEAVKFLREAGIKNISVDLMYGLPTQSLETWEESINGIIALNPEHISAYCLSVEEESPLRKLIEKGELSPADEDLCLEMAELLRKKLKEAGYIQYEISNYSKPGFESKHNSSYWDGTPYLGLGPGAHSYDGKYHRRWNIGDLNSYLKGERKENGETLSDKDIFNEKIMLGLRTNKGVSASLFENIDNYCDYKGDSKKNNYKKAIEGFISRGLLTKKGNNLILSESGLALADEVMRELFI